MCKIVLDTRSDEWVICQRSTVLITGVQDQWMITVNRICKSSFHCTFQEFSCATASQRFLRSTTITHLSITADLRWSNLTWYEIIEMSIVITLITRPYILFIYKDIIVITELITFTDTSVRIVQVILNHIRVITIITDRELINICI